jgi:hypothetical protein
MRHAVVDEPRLLVPGDDVDPETERPLGLGQKCGRVGRHAKRVGRHRPHRGRMQALDAFAEARKAREGRASRLRNETAAIVDAGADAQIFAPGVEAKDLIAFDASDLEPKAVRSHVDDGESLGRGGGASHGAREGNRKVRPGSRIRRLLT